MATFDTIEAACSAAAVKSAQNGGYYRVEYSEDGYDVCKGRTPKHVGIKDRHLFKDGKRANL